MPGWQRGLVKPPDGYGLGHLDYSSQEFGIAAALSNDQNMIAAYQSGDPYLWFAKKGGLISPDATRATLTTQRRLYKMAVLAINYEIGAESLGLRINRPVLLARHLIELHHDLFPDYWRWSNRAVDHAMLFGWQSSVFGWIFRLAPMPRPTALRNFPIQTNGAEMLRLGHCLATENGISVCAPIHDAYLIEATLEILDQEIARMRSYMAEASRVVLRGFELFTDVKVIRFPDRYSSSKGKSMWNLVMRLLEEIETEAAMQAVTELSVPV
jgi:DNA polymerase-1